MVTADGPANIHKGLCAMSHIATAVSAWITTLPSFYFIYTPLQPRAKHHGQVTTSQCKNSCSMGKHQVRWESIPIPGDTRDKA